MVSEVVEIRMTYSDEATFNNDMIDIPRSNFASVDTDHRIDLNLELTVTIGGRTWKGITSTGIPGSPYTFLVRTQNFTGAEFVKPIVNSQEGGTFSEFSLDAGEGDDQISLTFNGSAITFVGAGIRAADFSVDDLGSAEGFIQSDSSSNQLAFSIDPTTVQILNESDEIVPPVAPTVTASIVQGRAALSWQSDLRFRYRVESSPLLNMTTWNVIETKNGTGAIISVDYEKPADTTFFYRVVAVPRPTAQ